MDMSQLLRALGLQQAYQSYQQNIGQPFANVAGPFGRGLLGLDRPEYGQEQAYRTGQAVGNMPAVSAPVGAFKAAMQAPGLLADATQMAKQIGPELAGLLGLTAFHGSPHRFSKFDASKIGTGEGAQVYGHGLYFAENPSVAKQYQEKLTVGENYVDGEVLDSYNPKHMLAKVLSDESGNVENASEVLTSLAMPGGARDVRQAAKEALSLLQKGERPTIEYVKPSGSFYKLDIPDEMVGKMLDWDKPLSEQPMNVQNIAKELLPRFKSINPDIELDKMSGASVYRLYQALRGNQPDFASEGLRELGIPGIRYLDQGSRGAGAGTRNFVVFPGEEEALKMLSVE
jgi:hypothetical protein